MKRDFLTLKDITREELFELLDLAKEIKQNPGKYKDELYRKTLLMIFEKPSLRTRVSFEVAMTQLGGHAIYYNTATSPMGKKESIADTARTASRFVDAITARLYLHQHIEELAANASVPVINALTNFSHPCQILADLLTIMEKKSKLEGLKLAYFGDANNNVTHSLMLGSAMAGINITVACPANKEFMPNAEMVEWAKELGRATKIKFVVTDKPREAARNADVVYTDSWMSYHIPKEQQEERASQLMLFQVNQKLMSLAKPDAIFMNCLPAARGMEQTANVIDGPQSVVFDQAENRLHTEKALLVWLLKRK